MAIAKLNIEDFISASQGSLVIDVRSPAEYAHAHIPGAVNIPLFSNEERAAVGTAYKQQSREQAIKIGLDYFGPKMRLIVEKVEQLLQEKKDQPTNNLSSSNSLFIYCWRGGMRSAAIAWLLDVYGYKVHTLIGGYKKFRNMVIDTFNAAYNFNILGGYTGSGKTEVLNEMERSGQTVINLEKIANHKGSAFGNIGMPAQPTQEMFENLLALELRDKHRRSLNENIWLEDESQRIGLINIPSTLWKTMRNSPVYFLDIDFEARLDHIVEEYGALNQEQVIGAIERISKRLGSMEAKNAIEHLLIGKTRESFRILLTYYDRWYLKALHNREGLNSLLQKVKCDTVTPSNAKQLLPQPQFDEKP